MRDFMLEKYQELCQTLLECDYSILPVFDYLTRSEVELEINHKVAIVRHDVDRKPNNALKMAELEHSMGIHSTYYFRYPYTFKPEIMRQIQDPGHEIGYHYEVLAKAKGDPEKAITLFEKELRVMREVCDIRTICMHGSPLSHYDNRDLWKYYDFRDFGLAGEAYLSLQDADLFYFTDTGRSWNGRHSVRDALPNNRAAVLVETTNNLIIQIKSYQTRGLYLTTHPERWAVNEREWVLGYSIDVLINLGKSVLMAVQ